MSTTTYTVTATTPCNKCKGTGYYYDPHCHTCGAQVPHEFIRHDIETAAALPCGHVVSALREGRWCEECEGEGEIVRQVNLVDALKDLGVL